MHLGQHIGQHVGQHFGAVGVLAPVVPAFPKHVRLVDNAISCLAEQPATVLGASMPIFVTISEVSHG